MKILIRGGASGETCLLLLGSVENKELYKLKQKKEWQEEKEKKEEKKERKCR